MIVDCEKDVDFRRDMREGEFSSEYLFWEIRFNNEGIN